MARNIARTPTKRSPAKGSPAKRSPAKRSPAKRSPRKPPRDKIEISPNNRAKCHKCEAKIVKGEERYGFVEVNEYGRTQRYYHPRCCPDNLKDRLPSPEKRKQDLVLEEREELAAELRSLRSLFASELDVEPFYIFHNRSIDELVAKMPTTESGLLEIWGIKQRKVETFGDAILTVIKQYKRRQNPSMAATMGGSTARGKKVKQRNAFETNDGDDVDIALGETLTCEEIVQRKFEHARENGYVISVD